LVAIEQTGMGDYGRVCSWPLLGVRSAAMAVLCRLELLTSFVGYCRIKWGFKAVWLILIPAIERRAYWQCEKLKPRFLRENVSYAVTYHRPGNSCPYMRGRHLFVVSHVVGPTTTLQVQFWGGPLDSSVAGWWQAFTWSNENRGKAAASNPITCRKRKGRVSCTEWSGMGGRSYLQS